jgi:pseudomonalisin
MPNQRIASTIVIQSSSSSPATDRSAHIERQQFAAMFAGRQITQRPQGVRMFSNRLPGLSPVWPLIGLILAVSLPAYSYAASAQPPGPVARVTSQVDESQVVELKGHVHRAVRDSVDLGPADINLPVENVVMVLSASSAQETDLAQFLHDVQTRARPEYHHWLTPQSFGQRFGVAPADLTAVQTWLRSKGFHLKPQARSKRSIVFSGTIGQVNNAFAAAMHQYRWHGALHLANSRNPTIPRAFATVVQGFASLHDFRLQPQFGRSALRAQTDLSDGTHALGPGDFAIIYDLTSTYSNGVDGTGRSLAVIGRSDVQNVDISNFRSAFGLKSSAPTVILAGADPGLVADDETESDLDLEWAGAIAPSVSLKFVTAKSTNTTDGIALSSQFAVEQNVADVITVSYGACESASDVSGGTTFFNQLWQQAAAEGISVFVSSGDAGAAGCDAPASTTATHGRGVNLVCSSPYSTCVGGSEFTADLSAPSTYWSATNTAGTNSSAIQYIGEAVWNQSGSVSGGTDLWSSGGGASIYYAKPAWQLATGVPSDGYRDVPDVALNASSAHDPYLIYSSDGNSSSALEGIGGTSAAAPTMAAIAALVVQRQNGRVGSFNAPLYGLSGLQTGGGAAVFHAITSGNNSVPGQTGFTASAGDPTYNQATGLGSVDGGVLVAHWSDFVGSSSGLSPASVVVPATASIGSAALNIPSNTTWSASISGGTGWLTVTPNNGIGSAPLTYSATPNVTPTARTGTITIDGQVLTVTQAAASGGAAQLSASTSSVSFGTDEVGVRTGAQTVVVSNTGGTPITLGQISVTGAAQGDYAATGTCSTGLVLTPGASCFLQVTFDPVTLGARSAALQIGSKSVVLSGTGTEERSSDGPTPLWAYAMFAVLILVIGTLRQRTGMSG